MLCKAGVTQGESSDLKGTQKPYTREITAEGPGGADSADAVHP